MVSKGLGLRYLFNTLFKFHLTMQVHDDFRERMQKYGGWIVNILDVCSDFTMDSIVHEAPYTQVIARLEASRTMEDVVQVLNSARKEWIDRLNSPLVDALFDASSYMMPPFIRRLCAKGSVEALQFCQSRGESMNHQYQLYLCEAIKNGRLETASWLAKQNENKFLNMTEFHMIFGTGFPKVIRDLVARRSFPMIRWMVPFFREHDHYCLFEACAEYDESELVQDLVLEQKEYVANKVQRCNAHRLARALHALYPNFPFRAEYSWSSDMDMFRWVMEHTASPLGRYDSIEAILQQSQYSFVWNELGWQQLNYLLDRSTLSSQQKKDKIRIWKEVPLRTWN